jgi:hypothetical protein
MHVPNSQHRSRYRWRPPLAAVLLFTLALTGSAQAAEFDASLRAPMMKSQGELRSSAAAFGARYREIHQAAPEQLIQDSALARQQFDLKWQVQRAIDERKPLDELASLGIVSQGDGSYKIDLNAHPEWNDLHETIAGIVSRADIAAQEPQLLQRGFSQADVKALKDYVSAHDPDVEASADALPIVLGFAQTVRKFDKTKRPVPESLALSFFYQRAFANRESNRRWVQGLFARLEKQSVRVILSNFTETNATRLWAPENASAGIAAYLAQVRQADFEARVIAEAKGAAR